MHALAGALDDIVDFAEGAADQLALYSVEAPMEQAQAMTEVLVLSAAGRDPPARARRRQAQRAAPTDLSVAGIDPMIVIRWKDIFHTLESAVDACETVAQRARGNDPQARH